MQANSDADRRLRHALLKLRLAVATRIVEKKGRRVRKRVRELDTNAPIAELTKNLIGDSKPKRRVGKIRSFFKRWFGRR